MAAVTQGLGAMAALSSANSKKFQFTNGRSLSGRNGSFFIVESNGNPRSGLNRNINRTRQLVTNAVATKPDSATASTVSKPGIGSAVSYGTFWRYLSDDIKLVMWKDIQQRFKVDEEWQKDYIFKEMGRLWRASKSRLVKKQKTKGKRFREIREKQILHTCSRKGYARLREDMQKKSNNPSSIGRKEVWTAAHIKKNGEPICKLVDLLKKQFQEKQSEELSNIQLSSSLSVNINTLNSMYCKLLDWTGRGEVVAEGRWSSNDLKILVHHIRLGPNAVRVWVDVAMKLDAFL